jgi:hypothetical protein
MKKYIFLSKCQGRLTTLINDDANYGIRRNEITVAGDYQVGVKFSGWDG